MNGWPRINGGCALWETRGSQETEELQYADQFSAAPYLVSCAGDELRFRLEGRNAAAISRAPVSPYTKRWPWHDRGRDDRAARTENRGPRFSRRCSAS